MGTVPSGTVLSRKSTLRMCGMSPPVERSITVSAPCFRHRRSFSSAPSTSETTALLPMIALILQAEAMPMAIGSNSGWQTLAGSIISPPATSLPLDAAATPSRRRTVDRRVEAGGSAQGLDLAGDDGADGLPLLVEHGRAGVAGGDVVGGAEVERRREVDLVVLVGMHPAVGQLEGIAAGGAIEG